MIAFAEVDPLAGRRPTHRDRLDAFFGINALVRWRIAGLLVDFGPEEDAIR